VRPLKEEIIPNLSHPEVLSGYHLLKKTDTRLIFRMESERTGKSYIIKSFKRPGCSNKVKYLFRFSRSYQEWRVGNELIGRDIPTYPLTGYGVSRYFGFLTEDFLISREISGAEPLISWVEKYILKNSLSFPEKKETIRLLALFVRRIHDQGIFPTDLHQGNILIQTGAARTPVFYLIDLHSVRIKREVTVQNRIKNLVQLNSFRMSMTDRMRFVTSYLQEGELEGVSPEDFIQKTAIASMVHWRHMWKKRRKKCLRKGKEIEEWSAGPWKGMLRKDFRPYFFAMIEEKGFSFQGAGIKTLRKTSRGSVKEAAFSEGIKSRPLIVKEYKAEDFLSSLRTMFRTSRAKRAWVNAHNLLLRGISTPLPVAFGERKRLGMLRESVLLTEKIPGAKTSALFLKELSENFSDSKKIALFKRDFLIRLARLIRWMHQTGICHGDLKASNILVTLHKGSPFIFLVDMDGVRIRNTLKVNDVAKDLSRMRAAFSGILSQADQDYFIEIYRRGNRFFQDHEERIMKKVNTLAERKIKQKLGNG